MAAKERAAAALAKQRYEQAAVAWAECVAACHTAVEMGVAALAPTGARAEEEHRQCMYLAARESAELALKAAADAHRQLQQVRAGPSCRAAISCC